MYYFNVKAKILALDDSNIMKKIKHYTNFVGDYNKINIEMCDSKEKLN